MTRETRSASVPVKGILVSIAVSLLSMAALLAAASRLLIAIDHFEKYYEIACLSVWCLEALILSLFSRRSAKPLLFACVASLTVTFLTLIVAVCFGFGSIDLARLGLRLALYFGSSILISVLPKRRVDGSKKAFKRKRRL